ncbi:uncharacterized protein LOC128092980 [Culex pipiens pallens]|uniref:uncharacterized protein LOC128092980 n=1 Tax=Culex pipiens pallens TaxID=42434 RepID=UPI0022AABD70|nr:uncharacterized protein LOC128092980 [Culex pipiens pallens]
MASQRYAILLVGILFLIQRGTCQLDVVTTGVDPTATTTAAPVTARTTIAFTKTGLTSGFNVSSKNSIPRVQDQTNQTLAALNQTVEIVTTALANISTDVKDSLDEAVQNISKIVSTGAEFKLVENGFKSLATVAKTLIDAADKRMDRSLASLGTLLKASIAAIVKLERDNLGRMKLSSDEKTAARNLRSLENSFYKNMSTCLSTFNGSISSEIGTVENMLDTLLSEGQSTAADLAKAGCPSKECSALLRAAATTVAAWNTAISGTLNKLPNVNELTQCIATQVNMAKFEFATLFKNIAPPVDLRAVLTNNTDSLQTFIRSALSNFSTSYQKMIKPVTSRINLLRTVVSRNALTDPKTIIQNNFKPITTVDDSTVQVVNTLLPKITTLHRRAIAALINKDTTVSARINQAIGKDTSPNGTAECDAAIQNITAIKSTFNSSVIACHMALEPSISTLLTDVTSTTNATMVLFNAQMDSVAGFKTAAMQQQATQLKSKLTAGPQLSANVTKTVTDAVNKAYGTLEKCVNDAVKEAVADLDDKSNPVIKSCLAIA